MGTMGHGKMGNLSQIVPFLSDFPPIAYDFHTFFLHFPLGIVGTFSHFPIPPVSPPFPLIFPFPPFFFTSAASWLPRLRLTPTPGLPCALFGKPKDVQDCSAVPEEFLRPLFFALFLLSRFPTCAIREMACLSQGCSTRK